MSSRQQSLTASKLGQAAHGKLAKSGKAALTWMLIGTKRCRSSLNKWFSEPTMWRSKVDCMQLSRTCSHDEMSELLQSAAAGIRE